MTTGHLYRINRPGHRTHGLQVMDVTNTLAKTKATPGARRVRNLIAREDGLGQYDLGEAWVCMEERMDPLPMRYYKGATPETRRWVKRVNGVEVA